MCEASGSASADDDHLDIPRTGGTRVPLRQELVEPLRETFAPGKSPFLFLFGKRTGLPQNDESFARRDLNRAA